MTGRKCHINKKSPQSTSSKASSISSTRIKEIIENLKWSRHRDTTRQNYYNIWGIFNKFLLRLDVKPKNWEDRLIMFAAHLVDEWKKSTTIKSYISAIKAILINVG